ncbi:terpene synthase family protein [Amycolatopsis thailandensis]|uniref:terpene synthase family protein n=1 Tax=Amycolatopsis thailandensis TaxID=589330 RepID=UPI003639B5BC
MPQGVDLAIPFPSRVSADVARAAADHLAWPRSFGLLPDAESETRHLQGNYPELAGRFHPTAVGAQLDLAIDQLSWFFLFDDAFDGPWGRTPALAAQLVGRVERVLDQQGEETAPYPIAAAFADLWSRSREGMSEGWCRRAAANWRAYMRGYVTEAEVRLDQRKPTLQQQLSLRAVTIGVCPILDLAERLGHRELPTPLASSYSLDILRRLASEVVALDNDIVSVEKEEAIGDANLVLHFESERNLTRGEAIEVIRTMVADRTSEFVSLGGKLLESAKDLEPHARDATHRYYHDALCAVMRGAYDWEQTCSRYRPDYATAESPV